MGGNSIQVSWKPEYSGWCWCGPTRGRIEKAEITEENVWVDKRPLHLRVVHVFVAIIEILKVLVEALFQKIKVCFYPDIHQVIDLTDGPSIGAQRAQDVFAEKKMVVLSIPGLHARTTMWESHKNLLQKRCTQEGIELDFRIVKLHNHGNHSVEAIIQPLLEIFSTLSQRSNLPIIIQGTSLGGVLALECMSRLRERGATNPIFVGTINAALASKTVKILKNNNCCCVSGLHEELQDRFVPESPTTRTLIERVQSVASLQGTTKIVSYMGTEDVIVSPCTNQLPPVKSQGHLTVKSFAVYGTNHQGTTRVAAAHLVEKQIGFYKDHMNAG